MEGKTISLKLVQPAKSSGGDKYQVYPSTKESCFYIPQNVSRTNGVATETLTLNICLTATEESIPFVLLKQGKTGDDRYTSEDVSAWKGDMYLPHEFRNANNKIYVTFMI